MIYKEAKKFEQEMTNDRLPFEKIEMTDERVGYAVGWFYSEIARLKVGGNPDLALSKHMTRYDNLRKFILHEWMQVNSQMRDDDRTSKKLLGYSLEGMLMHAGEKVSNSVQLNILQGFATDQVHSIKRARQRAGLTQQQMCDTFEIPKRTLEDWDSGVAKPPRYAEKLILKELERMEDE